MDEVSVVVVLPVVVQSPGIVGSLVRGDIDSLSVLAHLHRFNKNTCIINWMTFFFECSKRKQGGYIFYNSSGSVFDKSFRVHVMSEWLTSSKGILFIRRERKADRGLSRVANVSANNLPSDDSSTDEYEENRFSMIKW